MPEVIFNGPCGRLQGRYQPGSEPDSPIAIILHPHPEMGGTMNNKVVYSMFQTFNERDFSVLRFNFRGVGRSQGEFDGGIGELSDAASALDWMQSFNASARQCWVAGYSFGAWISMQLLMRRPEIDAFISISPPANTLDFTFLAPCPSSGIMVGGSEDKIVPEDDIKKLSEKLQQQRGIAIDYHRISGATHFYENHLDELQSAVGAYVDNWDSANAA
jgi:alpha/beta superfamily hydrolase